MADPIARVLDLEETNISLNSEEVAKDEDRIISHEVPLEAIKMHERKELLQETTEDVESTEAAKEEQIAPKEEEASATEEITKPVIPRLEDLSQDPMIDDFGFYHKTDDDASRRSSTLSNVKKYRKFESKWVEILADFNTFHDKNPNQLKQLCRAGLPVSLRSRIWMHLTGADKLKQPGAFAELASRETLPIYDVIQRDIDRCYPDHFFFKAKESQGQHDLFQVLKAYAHYNPEVGYCQGMGRLVGLMLMQMPAEDTFWLLVATLDKYVKGYFTPSLDRFRLHAAMFESLLHKYIPSLARHLDKNEVPPLVYMTQWFLTLYTMALPWDAVLRVWDMFYCEGIKVLFRIGLAMLVLVKDHVLKECPTNVECIQFLLHIPEKFLEPEKLISTALKINLSRQEVFKLEGKASQMWQDSGEPARGTLTLLKKKKQNQNRV